MSDHKSPLLTREPEQLLTNELVGYNRLRFVPEWVWILLGIEVEPYDGRNRAQLPSDTLGSLSIGLTSEDEETSTRHRTRMSAGRRVHSNVEDCIQFSEPHPHWLAGESMWELVEYTRTKYNVHPDSPFYNKSWTNRVRQHAEDEVGFEMVDFDPIGYDPEWSPSENSGVEWFEKTRATMLDDRKNFRRNMLGGSVLENETARNFKLRIISENLRVTTTELEPIVFGEIETSPVESVQSINIRSATSISELILAILFFLREDALEKRSELPPNPPHGTIPKCWTHYNSFVDRLFQTTREVLERPEWERVRTIQAWVDEITEPPRKAYLAKWKARVVEMAMRMRLEHRLDEHEEPRFTAWVSHIDVDELEELTASKVVQFLSGHPASGHLLESWRDGENNEPGWTALNTTPVRVIKRRLSPRELMAQMKTSGGLE